VHTQGMMSFAAARRDEKPPALAETGVTRRRFVLPGGDALPLRLRAGDRITITDPEGRQPAELFAHPAAALDVSGIKLACSPLDALARACGDTMAAHAVIAAQPAAWHAASGWALFGPENPADSTAGFVARLDAACLLIAPGAKPAPDEQTAPTELHIDLLSRHTSPDDLPAPLAALKLDLRVPAASARSFRVAAGGYIQIIDVEGRHCSDFLAFDDALLAAGVETGIDPTATRTLNGAISPTPGLHEKYFDAQLRPLVELVRDTVGRHDTFMLACNAKYYEDVGYPGHANCTDNFNAALAPHGIPARRGWPAINFFYNTIVEPGGAIGLDEPWSRAGDYVLLRALTDLVCAVSSCADDIDPANGWNPTDIHVRVYDAAEHFSRGIAHRMTPDSEPKLTRESGFYPRTSQLTRNFIDYRGFWLPTCYLNEGPIAEYWACRERACLMDLSALRKFEILGPDAEALMQAAVTRDISKLAIGQIVYTAMCYPNGGMIDDGTVFRLAAQNFRWVCGDEYCGVWLRALARSRGLKVWVKSATDHLHNAALQGPKSRDILAGIITTPPHRPSIAELKWFRFTIGRIGGPQGVPVLVSRTGYTGELGYEIWCHPDQAPAVWDAIWEAGQPHGIAPLGLDALDMLRIEAGLVFAGYDFSDETDPFEAGIGFTVPASKTAVFEGDAALVRRRAHPARALAGLDIEGGETVSHGDPVHLGRARIGTVTSATRSPMLARTIALARLDIAYTAPGTAVEIGKLDGQQKRIAATVTSFPHVDPQKTRVRA
jgi:aminomethyltransferase